MSKKPNIIYIFSDQHNPSVMGNTGDKVIRTPNLDKLAEEGTSATNCYCNCPICVPSRASMLTSTYPQDFNCYLNDNCFPSDLPTVAHSLGAVGYETVLSGRMHFIGADQRHGFEKRFVGDFTWSYPGGRTKNHEEIWVGRDRLTYGPNKNAIKNSGGGSSSILMYDDDVTDAAIDYIENRNDDRPLFMTVGWFGPHSAFVGPKEYFDYYYDKVEVPEIEEIRSEIHPTARALRNQWGLSDVSQEDVRRCKAAYYAMVQKMDDNIGRLLKSVEKNLDMENTLIVYSTDHGEMIGDKGLFFKCTFYEGSVRVPLIFSWKGHVKEGFKLNNLTSLIDVTPTFIEAAEGMPLPCARGESLWENITKGYDLPEDRTVISEIIAGKALFSGTQYKTNDIKVDYSATNDFGAGLPKDCLNAMIRQYNYKFIMHGLAEEKNYELFDLEKDPKEEINFAFKPGYEKITEDLAAKLLEKWNPQKALDYFLNQMENIKILKAWYEDHDRGLVEEEWRPTKPTNYIL